MTVSTTATIEVDSASGHLCAAGSGKRLDTVLIKTSSRCNIDCSYCYVYRGQDTKWRGLPKRMRHIVLDAVQHRLIEHAGRQRAGFAIVLHGGEPLLLEFGRLAAMLRNLRGRLCPERYPISVQTNGTLLNPRTLDLFAETQTTVSVSIDGPKEVNDLGRLDHRGRSTFAMTLRGIHRLLDHPACNTLFSGTLSVIQPNVSPASVYGFLRRLRTPSMDFLLQDGNHDRLPPGKKNFESTEYGQWLIKLIDLYLADPAPVPVRIIDDTIKLCLGGSSQKEGRGKDAYGILTIETDGEIRKNDTLRTSFDGADIFSGRWNVTSTDLASVLSSQEYIDSADMQIPTCDGCRRCQLLDVCGGGMPLYRWSAERSYDNPSVYCHDHAVFIRHVIDRLHGFGLKGFTEHANDSPNRSFRARPVIDRPVVSWIRSEADCQSEVQPNVS